MAYDENSGKVKSRRVVDLLSVTRNDLCRVKVKGDLIECSANHRFYTAESVWIEAGVLAKKEAVKLTILKKDGILPIDASVRRLPDGKPCRVYNITVEKDHNYFVGKAGTLVHNFKTAPGLEDRMH